MPTPTLDERIDRILGELTDGLVLEQQADALERLIDAASACRREIANAIASDPERIAERKRKVAEARKILAEAGEG